MNAERIAAWLAEHPTVGRGRMLTVALELGNVVAEANRVVGFLDASMGDPTRTKYVELSVNLMLTRLKRAVEALDVVGDAPQVRDPVCIRGHVPDCDCRG